MFLVIQNSRLQFAVMDAVAKVVLNDGEGSDYELFLGLMNYRAAVEKERNALVHGCFGGSDQIEEGVAWIDSVHLSQYTVRANAAGVTDDAMEWVRDKTYVYELADLERIALDIENLHEQIGYFIGYLVSRHTTPAATDEWRAERYRQLSAEPPVAQAIATRRENLKGNQKEPG